MRMKYKKGRRLCYISHLDTLRTFIRACRRAKLPLSYSQGFNPHPLISFLMPLSLGFTSECEYVDIGLEGEISADEAIARLNAALPDGFLVVSAGAPHDKPGDITSAVYKVSFSGKLLEDAAGEPREPAQSARKETRLGSIDGQDEALTVTQAAGQRRAGSENGEQAMYGHVTRRVEGSEQFADGIARFFAQETIVAPKKSKRGIKEVDIRPMILDWRLDGPLSGNGVLLKNCVLPGNEPTGYRSGDGRLVGNRTDSKRLDVDWLDNSRLDGDRLAESTDGGLTLTLRLAAGSAENLNPVLVLNQLEGFLNQELTYHVCREKIFCGDREFA